MQFFTSVRSSPGCEGLTITNRKLGLFSEVKPNRSFPEGSQMAIVHVLFAGGWLGGGRTQDMLGISQETSQLDSR